MQSDCWACPGGGTRWEEGQQVDSEERPSGRREDCEKIVVAAQRNNRENVGCIILGRGENDEKVHEWLTTAASVPGFIGFAVGRTVFWEPLVALRDKKTTREDAVAEIARRYQTFVDDFETAKGYK